MSLIFENWKARCSSLGNIMTCLPEPITSEQLKELADLKKEKAETEKAGKRFFKYKQEAIDKLEKLASGKDELPPGCITHLEDIFRSQFWGRKRLLITDAVDKGIICEEDSLELISEVDGVQYWKNDEQLSNDFIQGCPDVRFPKIDAKSKFDMESFDKAVTLDPLWCWQVRGYAWLDNETEGKVVMTLVNNPIRQLVSKIKQVVRALGLDYDEAENVLMRLREISEWACTINPDEVDESFLDMWNEKTRQYQVYVDIVTQVERNMIFDYPAFLKQLQTEEFGKYQDFKLLTPNPKSLHIPAKMRVKRFPVTLEEKDIEAIKRRVTMCREWLVNRELETLKLLEE